MRVGGILLLWLLSVSDGFAASPRPTGTPCDPQTQTTSIRRLIRQAHLVGGPVAKRVKRTLFRVRPPRTAHVERGFRRAPAPDEQAIQNDAPIAYTAVPPVLSLEPIGISTDRLERLPFTPFASPQSPRGPPALV